jgi:formate dehydrogenase major subunit
MAVNLDACIHCNLCVRACREVQVNDVIGMAFRARAREDRVRFDDPMGVSTCVACGECVQACPTGALMPKSIVDENQRGTVVLNARSTACAPIAALAVRSPTNPHRQRRQRIIAYVEGKGGPANENRLCVKGRFGFDYVASPERLTKPLIRKPTGLPKGINMDPLNPLTHFREASWEEALEFASRGLRDIRGQWW